MNDAAPNPGSASAPDPLAVALSKLDPSPHGFNRDTLMFSAGQASKLNALAFWRATAAIAIIAAGVFATLYFTRPTKIEYFERQVISEQAR